MFWTGPIHYPWFWQEFFEPIEPLGIVFGMGYEFAPEENLLLLRGGLEHCWTIDEKWGVFINLLFDYKPEAYDSWSFWRRRKETFISVMLH